MIINCCRFERGALLLHFPAAEHSAECPECSHLPSIQRQPGAATRGQAAAVPTLLVPGEDFLELFNFYIDDRYTIFAFFCIPCLLLKTEIGNWDAHCP